MARAARRRQFGSIDKLPSGRWRARYPDPDGKQISAPNTFATKADAELFMSKVRADRDRGTEYDPRKGSRTLADFAATWIDNGGSRGHLGKRTANGYRRLLALHIEPTLGAKRLANITPEDVRTWHGKLTKAQAALAATTTKGGAKRQMTGTAIARQSYALLRSVLATAVADGLIPRNPCQVRGAGVAKAEERPLLTLEQYTAIVEEHPEWLRPVVHTAMGAHLRLGEVVALRRGDYNAKARTLEVERQIAEDGAEAEQTKTGKRRTADLPALTAEVLDEYIAAKGKALPGAPLFTRPDGRPITRATAYYWWTKARKAAGVEWAHEHDVRHLGLTLAAQSGATLRELMHRAGHSSSRAALIYQHLGEERGKIVAAGLDTALRGVAE